MLFRLRVNTSFRPPTRRPPARTQSYDFLARACHSPAYSRHPALRLTPADSKQAQHAIHPASCPPKKKVSMTQASNASFTSEAHTCADSTRSLLTSERTSERASSRLPQQQPRSDIISASTAAFHPHPHPHPPLSPRCVIKNPSRASHASIGAVSRCAPSSGISHVMHRSPSRTSNAMQPSKLSIYISTLPLDIYSK